jgi:hypothetical protein
MGVFGWILVAISVVTLARGIALVVVLRRIPLLKDRVQREARVHGVRDPLPSVTICCAGRNEAAHLEDAIRSWLEQDLPNLQVIFADDRSSDESFAILERLAAEDPRVVALRIEQRPDGWLGKCHALHQAARRAKGDYILFTDADVKLAPGALAKAAALCRDERADHLVLLPEVETDSALQHAFTIFFFHEFVLLAGGLSANRDDGRCILGVGAFNMVSRAAYESVGGHEEIRMQVGDDVALARLLGRAGFRHRVLGGQELVSLHWQRGVVGTIRGLEKNAFWGARLSVPLLVVAAGALVVLQLPLVGPAFGAPGWAALAIWLIGVSLPHLASAPFPRSPLGVALHPVSVLLFLATLGNSALRVLHRGGIDWRGDVFTLAELRAGFKPLAWWAGNDRDRGGRRPETAHGESDRE